MAGVRSGAPTILNHPFLRLSICVEVNSHQGHGVWGTAGECLDTLFLIHAESRTHQWTVIVEVYIQNTSVTIEELAYVAREIHHGAVLDGSDSHLFDILDRKVYVRPVLAIVSVAVVIDLIQLIIIAARIVHQHDIVVFQIVPDIFLEEGLRRIFLRLYRIPFSVFASPREFRRRLSQVQYEHTVNRT